MVRTRFKSGLTLLSLPFFCWPTTVQAQVPSASPLDVTGQLTFDGRPTPYLIRHLPVNAYPQLPPAVQSALTHRGCLIPQTYEAHQPENVVNASLEHAGSSDWAVLCSAAGSVSLLVFIEGNYADPIVLASAPETERLQSHGPNSLLGFNWAIDAASPEDVHEAQLGMKHLPPRLEHDALADSSIDERTVYHFYSNRTWTLIDTHD